MDRIKQLSLAEGKILAFGGVYSNFQALTALKEIADKEKIPANNIICTGDIVGYCAKPKESLSLIKDWGIHSICGNVEIQLRNGEEDCGCDFSEDSRCDLFSKQWYPYAQKKVDQQDIAWLHSLPEFLHFTWNGKKVGVLHGSFENTSEFIFKSTPWEKKARNFDSLDADIIIAGHCGLPFYDVHDNKTWINPGIIGMPANDGLSSVWYATLEMVDGALKIDFNELVYDFLNAQSDMEQAKLPAAYSKTLATGIWDNCDILPALETSQQGQLIQFNGEPVWKKSTVLKSI